MAGRIQKEQNQERTMQAQGTDEEQTQDVADMQEPEQTLAVRPHEATILSLLEQEGRSIPIPFSRDILLMRTMINGAMHVEDIHALAAALQEGAVVRLVLEPDNPYDEMAILVRDPDGNKLGYIPRRKNEVLYHLLDAGKNLYGVVVGGDIGNHLDEEDPWVEIYIEVYMKD